MRQTNKRHRKKESEKMREVKDTLGIKYEKYTSIYNLDDAKVGALLKYLMWENGKDVILKDVSALTKKRIEKRSKEIEERIEKMLDDAVFEIVFNEMTQQVKRSHRCWQQLKDNLDKNKNDNKEEATEETEETETAETTEETETTTSAKEKTETTTTTTDERVYIESRDFYYDENGNVHLSEKEYQVITENGYNWKDIVEYMENNRDTFDYDFITIEEVLDDFNAKKLLS